MKDIFLRHRQIGQVEAYYRLFPSLHLCDSNLGVVFLHTGFNKSKFLKKLSDDEAKRTDNLVEVSDREGYYVETSSIHDKYLKRPSEIFHISLMQFAKRYTPVSKAPKDEKVIDENYISNEIDENFIISLDEQLRQPLPWCIELQGSFYPGEPRYLKLRSPLVVRLHKFKKHDNPHEWCFAELELYHIFDDDKQRRKCQEDLEFCQKVYEVNKEKINYVKSKTMPYLNIVEEALDDADRLIETEEIEAELDAENAQDNFDALQEGISDSDQFIAFDFDEQTDKKVTNDKLFKRIELSDIDILNSETKSLDDDQLFVVNSAIDYAKSYKKSINGNKKLPHPILMKIVGSAGTGKSHVIHLVTQWTEYILRSAGDDLDCPYVIKTAFTGSAACNIGKDFQ